MSIIFPQFSKRWKLPKNVIWVATCHQSSCTFHLQPTPGPNHQPTHHNETSPSESVRLRISTHLAVFASWRWMAIRGLQPQRKFQDAATHFNFHKNLQVIQNYLLGDSWVLVVRIHFTFFLICCQEKVLCSLIFNCREVLGAVKLLGAIIHETTRLSTLLRALNRFGFVVEVVSFQQTVGRLAVEP